MTSVTATGESRGLLFSGRSTVALWGRQYHRRWRSVWSARLLLALYLALYLVAVGPATSYVWARGGHVTLDQLAYHARLVQLGFPDHHERLAAGHARDDGITGASRRLTTYLASATPVFTTLTQPLFFPESAPLALAGIVALLLLLEIGRRSRVPDDPPPPGLRPAPPEPPPKITP